MRCSQRKLRTSWSNGALSDAAQTLSTLTLLQSPPLTALMDKALQASPTLVAAQAALRQALEGVQLTV